MLLGHSFGGLVLENTISHSILDASSNGSRNSSPRWINREQFAHQRRQSSG